MRPHGAPRRTKPLSLSIALACIGASAAAAAQPDFSGVWGIVQHDRLGAPLDGPPPVAKTLGF